MPQDQSDPKAQSQHGPAWNFSSQLFDVSRDLTQVLNRISRVSNWTTAHVTKFAEEAKKLRDRVVGVLERAEEFPEISERAQELDTQLRNLDNRLKATRERLTGNGKTSALRVQQEPIVTVKLREQLPGAETSEPAQQTSPGLKSSRRRFN